MVESKLLQISYVNGIVAAGAGLHSRPDHATPCVADIAFLQENGTIKIVKLLIE